MRKIIKLNESDLSRIVNKVIKEKNKEYDNYMFFSNLQQIIRQCNILLEMDPQTIDEILTNGHDWADDHITEAKTNIDQVFDFLMNETEKTDEMGGTVSDNGIFENEEITEKKNVPTNPKLWKQSLAWAKSRYKVCPSAYCNGAAVKRYNSKGGKWKRK